MSGSYQINVMSPLLLKAEKNLSQFFRRKLLSRTFLTDLIVLAETASQITAGKEYCAASTGTADTGLLPVMESGSGTS